jgi:hypothetical protein
MGDLIPQHFVSLNPLGVLGLQRFVPQSLVSVHPRGLEPEGKNQ